jgi:TetR/AcrR family transcriptional regulator, transcriptional repressor for nem operon
MLLLLLTKRSRIVYSLAVARTKAFDRDAVLEKAMYSFWQRGYEATSMQDLVDAMGINRQSLYDTFGDKHELYLQTLEHYRCSEATTFLTPLGESKPLRQRLEKMFDLIIEEAVSDKDRKGCFIANATLELASQDKAVCGFVAQNFENSVKKFEQVLSAAKTKGELGADKNVKALAVFIVNTIGGLRVTAKVSLDKAILKSIVKTTLAAFE